jgi:hypothetical protein
MRQSQFPFFSPFDGMTFFIWLVIVSKGDGVDGQFSSPFEA